ncbi:amidase [Zafaria cholistanensis]|uniref:Amidase n=1 Tax=Zafaria cholistanensis TaxID=1682741 RepID=A0A5A7NRY9_9MICC|nr:amidase [Zafaria cholistanensis]GER23565.1 amidase [Zafaria cholistanensis]
MTATDTRADGSREAIRRQAEAGQALTRSRALPASPDAGELDPDAYAARLARLRGAARPSGVASSGAVASDAGTPATWEGAQREGAQREGAGGDTGRPDVAGLLGVFGSGTATPSAVLERYLDHWAGSATTAAAVLHRIEGAREAAAASDARWAAGTARPLEGIPFGVKDIIDVAGAQVTCGSLQTGDRTATEDAAVVARLREAGAIPVAMVATTEFAMGSAWNARYGPVPNPWNPGRWTGGSSTGSGAGLAAGLFPFALGTDTGGSIRIPSAFCGTTGLKPTYGRLPRTGVATLSWSLDHVGPMGLSAADLQLLLPVLDGSPPASAAPVPALPGPAGAPLAGTGLGVLGGWHGEPVDAAVAEAFAKALDTLRSLGAEVKVFDAPGYDPELSHVEAWNVFYGEIAATQEANLPRQELFDAGTRDRFEQGRRLAAIDYLRGLRRRAGVLEALLEGMDASGVDYLVLPTVPAAAPRLADMTMLVNGEALNIHDVLPRNTRIFDYTGMPALALPMGFDAEAMPLSLQVAGRPWDDEGVLAVGAAFQSATGFHRRVPGTEC